MLELQAHLAVLTLDAFRLGKEKVAGLVSSEFAVSLYSIQVSCDLIKE